MRNQRITRHQLHALRLWIFLGRCSFVFMGAEWSAVRSLSDILPERKAYISLKFACWVFLDHLVTQQICLSKERARKKDDGDDYSIRSFLFSRTISKKEENSQSNRLSPAAGWENQDRNPEPIITGHLPPTHPWGRGMKRNDWEQLG